MIRIDLLGHGGSEKPTSGYSIEDQAALVAGALDRLGVQGAVVVGHSMGVAVAVSLAEQREPARRPGREHRRGPDTSDTCELPFTRQARATSR